MIVPPNPYLQTDLFCQLQAHQSTRVWDVSIGVTHRHLSITVVHPMVDHPDPLLGIKGMGSQLLQVLLAEAPNCQPLLNMASAKQIHLDWDNIALGCGPYPMITQSGGLALLPQLRTELTVCPLFRILHRVSWGLQWGYALLLNSAPFPSLPFLPIHCYWSKEHPLKNLLCVDLHLIICFLGKVEYFMSQIGSRGSCIFSNAL